MSYNSFLLAFITSVLLSNVHSSLRSTGCGSIEQPSPNNSTIQFTFPHNDLNRLYLIHLPPTYNHNSSTGSPLVFGFHGFTSHAQTISDQFLMNPHANKHNYIAIYPQGSFMQLNTTINNETVHNLTSWNDLSCSGSNILTDSTTCLPSINPPINNNVPSECRINDPFNCNWCNCLAADIDFIDKLIEHIFSQYCIDRTRIYSLGFSNGAMFTQRLACALPHRFAAIAPFHGQLSPAYNCIPNTDTDTDYFVPISIFNVWGWRDDIVPGDSYLSSTGAYFAPVSSVMLRFAQYNGCDMRDGLEVFETVSDAIQGWQCIGFTQGCINDSEVISCSWNGTHVYPVILNDTTGEYYNFGLEVVWEFFIRHTREVMDDNDDSMDESWNIVTIIIAVSVASAFVVAIIAWIVCHVKGNKMGYHSMSDGGNAEENENNPSQPLTSTTKTKQVL